MTTRSSVLRKASARIEALETRSFFSGEIDHTFGTLGLTTASVSRAEAVQSDGKIVVVGASTAKGQGSTAVVVRYLANGQVDKTFGTSGTTAVPNVYANNINAVSVLANGRILVQGQDYVRLTAAGKLDTTFGGGDGIAPSALAGDRRAGSVVLTDGSYVELQTLSGGQARLFKFNADGSADKTFGSGGSLNVAGLPTAARFPRVGGVAVDSKNRLYVSYGAGGDPDGGEGEAHVVRLTAAGKIDTTYGVKGIASYSQGSLIISRPIAVLSDGRVVLTGIIGDEEANYSIYLVAFSADGKSGTSVILAENGPNDYGAATGVFEPTKIIAATDGTFYLGGTSFDGESYYEAGNTYAGVLHLTKQLTIDTTFTPDKDGLAGFRTNYLQTSVSTRFADAALTGSGDIVILGATGWQGNLVKFAGDTKPTAASYALTEGQLTLNGTDGDDAITAENFGKYSEGDYTTGTLVVNLDERLSTVALISRDILAFDPNAGTAITKLTVNLKGGNDSFSADTQVGPSVAMVIDGGDGNDDIDAGYGPATVTGDAGNDTLYGSIYGPTLVDGGAGNDQLSAGSGHATLRGGDGDDVLYHTDFGAAADKSTLDGGNGHDFAYYSAGDTLISIEGKSMDDPSNDPPNS